MSEEKIFTAIEEKGYYPFSKNGEKYKIFGLVQVDGVKFWMAVKGESNNPPFVFMFPFSL